LEDADVARGGGVGAGSGGSTKRKGFVVLGTDSVCVAVRGGWWGEIFMSVWCREQGGDGTNYSWPAPPDARSRAEYSVFLVTESLVVSKS
jgi:hypothetical protein